MWNTRGLVAGTIESIRGSEAATREAIRLRPRYAAAYTNLSNALWEPGHHAMRPRRREALRDGARPPRGSEADLAKFLIEMEDPDLLDEAESGCHRAFARTPRSPLAINNLGNIFRSRGCLDEAMAVLPGGFEMGSASSDAPS